MAIRTTPPYSLGAKPRREAETMTPKKQKFMVKHSDNAEWTPGLRSDFEYCDLGIKDATDGKFDAHIIRIADKDADITPANTRI